MGLFGTGCFTVASKAHAILFVLLALHGLRRLHCDAGISLALRSLLTCGANRREFGDARRPAKSDEQTIGLAR
jgi:hypothetical protein